MNNYQNGQPPPPYSTQPGTMSPQAQGWVNYTQQRSGNSATMGSMQPANVVTPQQMMLPDANQAQAKLVAAPGPLQRIFNHMVENPLEIMGGVAAAYIVRAGLAAAIGITSTGLLPAIGLAMATSFVLSVGKDMLFGEQPAPDATVLGNAHKVKGAGAILDKALGKAIWSGAFAGLFGIALHEIMDGLDAAKDAGAEPKMGEDLEVVKVIPYEGNLAVQAETKTWEAMSEEELKKHFAEQGPKNADINIRRGHEHFNEWTNAKDNLRGDILTRDATQAYPGHVVSSSIITDGIGYDHADARYVYEKHFGKLKPYFPDEMLSSEEVASYKGKTIVIDIGHYNLVEADASSNDRNFDDRYDPGSVYGLDGTHYTNSENVKFDTGERYRNNPIYEHHKAFKGLFDADQKPYTFNTVGPAFDASGRPVGMEWRVNMQHAIEFGNYAEEQLGANVVYTNLGKLNEGSSLAEQFEYRKNIVNQLVDDNHAPDMYLSFHADGADPKLSGMGLNVPEGLEGSKKFAEHLAESCDAEITYRKGKDLALFRDLPQPIVDGTPMVIVEMGNLANAQDNFELQMGAKDRLAKLFKGTANYFVELDKALEVPEEVIGASADSTDVIPPPPSEDNAPLGAIHEDGVKKKIPVTKDNFFETVFDPYGTLDEEAAEAARDTLANATQTQADSNATVVDTTLQNIEVEDSQETSEPVEKTNESQSFLDRVFNGTKIQDNTIER